MSLICIGFWNQKVRTFLTYLTRWIKVVTTSPVIKRRSKAWGRNCKGDIVDTLPG